MDTQEDGNIQELLSIEIQKMLRFEKNSSMIPKVKSTLYQENAHDKRRRNPFTLDTSNSEWDGETDTLSEQTLDEMVDEYEKKFYKATKYFKEPIDERKNSLKMLDLQTNNWQRVLQTERSSINESSDLCNNEKELVDELVRPNSLSKLLNKQYESICEGNQQKIWENFNKFRKLNEEIENIYADINERKKKYMDKVDEEENGKDIELPQKDKELKEQNCATGSTAAEPKNLATHLDSLVLDSEKNYNIMAGKDQTSEEVNLSKFFSEINETTNKLIEKTKGNEKLELLMSEFSSEISKEEILYENRKNQI